MSVMLANVEFDAALVDPTITFTGCGNSRTDEP
jgi:hypothetical protein